MSGPVILEETTAVLDALGAQDGPHLAELTAPEMREVYRQLGDAFDLPTTLPVRTVDFEAAGVPVRSYFPGGGGSGPVIVFMHGGGWVIGDLDTHDALCRLIASVSGLRVVAVDYALAPEHAYPRAHEDCLAAADHIATSPAELEAPVTGIAVAGDSAGGNLAFHVAATRGRAAILAQLLIYPVGDSMVPETGSYEQFASGYLLDQKLMERFIGDYMPDAALRGDRPASPLRHDIGGDLPPAVIVTAGLDPLRDQGRKLAGALIAAGNESHYLEAEGLIHGMATMRRSLPTADGIVRRAVAIFSELIRAETGKTKEFTP